MVCELCEAKKVTPWYYEDGVVWVADCKSHPNKKIMVLKRHTEEPTTEERMHMIQLTRNLFPDIKWRGPASLKEHFHLHEC